MDADDEDNRGEGRRRAGSEAAQSARHQHDDGDHRHHQWARPGAPPRRVHDCGLGGAAVDAEGAGDPGGQVGDGEPHQVAVLVQLLLTLLGEAARGGGALGQDDHEDRGGDGGQTGNLAPRHVGKTEGGRPAGTDPTMATPWWSSRRMAVRTIEAATTRRVPGIRLDTTSRSRMTATAAIASAAAGTTMWPRELSTVPTWPTTPPLAWMPSIPGTG